MNLRRLVLPLSLSLSALVLGSALACSIPSSSATVGILAPSDSMTEWVPVADYLEHRCGTLDCHGNPQRNWVSWGCEGLRADPTNSGGCGLTATSPNTTSVEYEDTYRSLVALEPVTMSEVVSSGGQNPDLLTFIRKARGEENHKGGALVVPGDPQDLCMTSWLAGSTDAMSCKLALRNYQ